MHTCENRVNGDFMKKTLKPYEREITLIPEDRQHSEQKSSTRLHCRSWQNHLTYKSNENEEEQFCLWLNVHFSPGLMTAFSLFLETRRTMEVHWSKSHVTQPVGPVTAAHGNVCAVSQFTPIRNNVSFRVSRTFAFQEEMNDWRPYEILCKNVMEPSIGIKSQSRSYCIRSQL